MNSPIIHKPWNYVLGWSVLLTLGLIVYGQTLTYGFVFDDYIFIVTNSYVKNFHTINIIWSHFPLTRFIGMYSFAFNYSIHQLNPFGYHLFNLIVHLSATTLVWVLSKTVLEIAQNKIPNRRYAPELPFFIALLFLVHPGQTQAITYITQRFESLATVFYLGAIYCYLQGRLSLRPMHKIILLSLTGFLTFIGILTKEVAATIPLMLLACEWILLSPSRKLSSLWPLLGFGLVLFGLLFMKLVHSGLNVFVAPIASESHDGDIFTPVQYALTQMRVFLTFIRLLLLPIHQNLEYDYPMSTGLLHPPLTLAGLMLIGIMIYIVIQWRQRQPVIAFGLSWMLITFVINMVPRNNVIFEHKLYLISFGFFLILGAGLSQIISNRKTLWKIFLCLIALWSFLSFERNRMWKDELTLWEDIARKSPHKSRVNANLGRVYGLLNRNDEAVLFLSKAIASKPQDYISRLNRGIIYDRLGNKEKALEDMNDALRIDPHYFFGYIKRAYIYEEELKYEAAFADLAQAIDIEPNHPDSYVERGLLWAKLGHREEALKDFHMALNLDPLDPQIKAQYMAILKMPSNPS